ncbi:hypothetical protein [Streptomyces sp. NPDC088182]|uniref:hypothetical protein n=1 Tax=Streptomyces sp. NPDC088182 TaxID=3365838 RepID=UPI0038079551
MAVLALTATLLALGASPAAVAPPPRRLTGAVAAPPPHRRRPGGRPPESRHLHGRYPRFRGAAPGRGMDLPS